MAIGVCIVIGKSKSSSTEQWRSGSSVTVSMVKKEKGISTSSLQKTRTKASMSTLLPQEIIFDVLSRLPVKSLLRFRCVCKPWCDIIRNPSFVKMHLQRSTENQNFSLLGNNRGSVFSVDYNVLVLDDDDEVVEIDYPFKCSHNEIFIVGSCNGLVCVIITEMFEDNITCIWNPSTKEYKYLEEPPSEYIQSYDVYHQVCGFGYDSINDDYKLVRIMYFDTVDEVVCETHVITLGSDSWREIGDSPYDLMETTLPGMHVNGALHWNEDSGKVIVSFDLGDEEYQEVPLPKFSDGKKYEMHLGVLNECLCMICNLCDTLADIWMMKDYGVRESWTKLFTIAQPTFTEHLGDLRLVKMDRNGGVLLNEDNEMSLAYLGPKRKRVRILEVRGLVQAYVRSIIPLNSGTYVGQA